jgi:hypothetical protein
VTLFTLPPELWLAAEVFLAAMIGTAAGYALVLDWIPAGGRLLRRLARRWAA